MRLFSSLYIFLLLIGLSLTQDVPDSNFCVWKNNGNYKHNECSKYYACYWGKTTLSECPTGLVFDQIEQYGQCTAMENVPSCQKGNPTTETSNEGFSCLNRPEGFYRHPDCSKYYRCYNNFKLQVNNCPPGLFFNLPFEYCDYPTNVPDCIGGTVNIDALPVTSSPSPIGFCTGKANGNYLYSTCSNKFYSCFAGVTKVLECLSNELFHHNQRRCMAISNYVECGGSVVATTTSSPPVGFCTGKANGNYLYSQCLEKFYSCFAGVTKVLNCPLSEVFHANEKRCISRTNYPDCGGSIIVTPTSGPIDSFSCLNRPDSFYRHRDCTKFYRCYSKNLQVKKCPPNLYYNPDFFYCDYPTNVPDCISGTVDLNAKPPSTTPISIGFCTGKANGNYVYAKCYGKFYSCFAGVTKITDCSAGEVFSEVNKRCVSRQSVPECGGSKGNDASTSKPIPNSFSCASRVDGFYRHSDCSKYYRCVGKKLYTSSCPPKLYFNPNTLACDYPANVPDCINGILDQGTYNGQQTTRPELRPDNFNCIGKDNGIYADTSDCSKFYSCYSNKISQLKCSEGLAFNPRTKQCDLLKNVPECRSRKRRNTGEEFSCDDRDDGYYPDSDCTRYYICLGERINVMNCTNGLVYNEKIKNCDWRRNVPRCKYVQTTEPPRITTTRNPFCFYQGDGAHHILNDCVYFYYCWKEQMQKLPCPKGLFFNDILKYCDWPENVPQCLNAAKLNRKSLNKQDTIIIHHNFLPKCDNGEVHKHIDCSKYYICWNNIIYVQDCPKQTVFNSQKGICDWNNNVPECSLTNLEPRRGKRYSGKFSCRFQKDKFYKNQEDCKTFFQCVKERLFIQICPKGLVYNEKTEYCDWPSNVPDCDNKPSASPLSNNPKDSESSIKEPCRGKGDGFYKHKDCTKFYRCSSDVDYILPCPNGLVFNEKIGGCDWAKNVPDCQKAAKNSQVKVIREVATTFTCKDKQDGYYKHQDCSKYYRCISEEILEQECALGLHFNQKTASCDWPANVPECKSQIEVIEKIDSEFSCKQKQDGVYKHHNCSKYYLCLSEQHLEQDCAIGLYFNQKMLACDWPENVPECNVEETATVTTVIDKTPDMNEEFSCKGKPNGYYKHVNCSKYYHCLNDELLEQECANGLYFNEITMTCDWPVNVPQCDQKEETTDSPTGIEEFSCPNYKDGYYKHPNCRLFYRCINGVATVKSCDKGFYFNAQKSYCDWKANVPECKKST